MINSENGVRVNKEIRNCYPRYCIITALSFFNQKKKASLSSDTVTIFQLNDIQTSSFLLKMQQKRQEQQKSIDAYYNKSIHNALLSQVASEFYRRISLATLTRDNIEHRDAFSGKEAIVRPYKRKSVCILLMSCVC